MNKFDTSDELIIQRHHQGVKFVRPEKANIKYSSGFSIADAMKLSFNITFLNAASTIQKINDQSAATVGFVSPYSGMNKSIYDIATKESAQRILKNNQEVIESGNRKICDEMVLRKDDVSYHTLSIKFPIYNNQNKIAGLVGCGVTIGKHSLGKSLTQIIEYFGPLALSQDFNNPNSLMGLKLTKREGDILKILVRGKTAKEVANQLNLSYRTVENYLANIKIKMGVMSKSELIEKVIDLYGLE